VKAEVVSRRLQPAPSLRAASPSAMSTRRDLLLARRRGPFAAAPPPRASPTGRALRARSRPSSPSTPAPAEPRQAPATPTTSRAHTPARGGGARRLATGVAVAPPAADGDVGAQLATLLSPADSLDARLAAAFQLHGRVCAQCDSHAHAAREVALLLDLAGADGRRRPAPPVDRAAAARGAARVADACCELLSGGGVCCDGPVHLLLALASCSADATDAIARSDAPAVLSAALRAPLASLRHAGLALFAHLALEPRHAQRLARGGAVRALKAIVEADGVVGGARRCDALDWHHLLTALDGLARCAPGLKAMRTLRADRWLREAGARHAAGAPALLPSDAALLARLARELEAVLLLAAAARPGAGRAAAAPES
jgi:hypothetical protein